jgi:hypothetical protein
MKTLRDDPKAKHPYSDIHAYIENGVLTLEFPSGNGIDLSPTQAIRLHSWLGTRIVELKEEEFLRRKPR